ncbi:MAG: ABC transporter ATP-binding protein [Gammaproteobacteria bacterium]|nr:ABC transporter ATP-binding protein [Gammaproteobacteria bacterium]
MPAEPTLSADAIPKQDVHIEFDDVCKSFDQDIQVIQNLNLTIQRGEFLTMLGPSGSGKTTCLMMLAGFENPTSGSITVDNQPIHQLLPHKRNIGMVFQHYALFPHMNVGKNLAFPLEVRGVPAPERSEKIERVLELVQLEGFQDRMPTQLSGGQQQRVAIARALVFEPDIVLMDEPLGALDRRLREEMQYEIRRLHQQLGVTMVYVTHDQQEAMVLSDQVAVLQDGKIEQIAPPETLYEEPNRVFVSSFIGDNNVIYGVVKKVDENEICHVDMNGEDQVQALTVTPHKPGDEVWITVRPERIQLYPKKELYTNEFNAVVDDIVFMGDHLRLSVTTCGIKNFIIKIQNIVGHGGVLPGDTVRIGWAALDCRALAKEK